LFFLMPNNENVNHGNSWRPDIAWPLHERRRLILRSALVSASFAAIVGFVALREPNMPWWIDLLLALVLFFGGAILFVVAMLVNRALDTGNEINHVRACLQELEHQKYDHNTIEAIKTAASYGGNLITARTPLPIVLITAVATISVGEGLDILTRILIIEIVAAVLLGFVVMTEQSGALDTGNEINHVRACLQELEHQKYDHNTIEAIKTAASYGGNLITARTPLPIVLITAVATISVGEGLDILTRILIIEIVAAVLLGFVVMTEQSGADVIILRALAEYERRLVSDEHLLNHPMNATTSNIDKLKK